MPREDDDFRTFQDIDGRGAVAKTGTEDEDHRPECKEASHTHVTEERLREKGFEKIHVERQYPIAVAALPPGLRQQHGLTMHQHRSLPKDSQDPEYTITILGLQRAVDCVQGQLVHC